MIDFTKPVQVRGRPARIICTDRKREKPIIALVENDDGSENLYLFHSDGKGHFGNLENVPEKVTVWMQIYRDYAVHWPTKEEADKSVHRDCLACVPVTYTVGEGL